MTSLAEIRSRFPQLQEKVYGKPLVYLDNAATSLRPVDVISKWDVLSSTLSSNLHRAVHFTANKATEEFEETRVAAARFLGADNPKEIVFTSGTTHSLNLLAFSLGEMEGFMHEGDEIVIGGAEHHSNILPWQFLAKRKGLKIKVLPVEEDGTLAPSRLQDIFTPRTRICCIAQVSNVLGIINPVRQFADFCHSNGTLLVVDGAQGVVHCKTDVKSMGADFYAFSGHKLYAAPGTGVLWGRMDLLEKMPPYMGGGEMIGTVKWEGSTFAPVPHKFEAGTQNIAGIPTLKPAFKLAEEFLKAPYIEDVKQFVLKELLQIPGLHLYGLPRNSADKIPLFSFSVEGAHHEDLALILDKMGIAVRSGQMCAEPLMDRFGVTGMLRASFAPYNGPEDAEYFIKSLRKAIDMLV